MAFAPEPALVALVDAIRGEDAPARMEADLEGFLRERGVAGDDLRVLVQTGARRLLVYRALVHNRMRNATRDFVPRTIARLGKERFARDFAAFVAQRAARSFYLRDVPEEFVQWAAPRWAADDTVPPWLGDLARHELLQLTIRNVPGGGEPATGEAVALDRPLRFDGSARLMTYAYAVHKLPSDEADRSAPQARPTHMLVYRDADHTVRYLELTPFAAAALAQLVEHGRPVAEGLQQAAASLGEPLDDDHLGAAARLLADLADRGVLLGAE